MKIELRRLSEIRPYEQNPRLNDEAVAAVARSIQEFGFRQPIVVDPDGVIICGHTRYKAALQLGLEKVPVHVARDLSPAQIRAYRIADNKTAELAEWNYDLLPIELSQLAGLDFDLSLLGFDQDELAKLLGDEAQDGLCDPDDIPAPPDEAITRPGDLWLLGEHRLICGDASKAEDVDRLLDGATIQLVNTDPPYNVKLEPRSNNAIAAGLSSFQGTTHHQGLDVARHPEKAKPTGKKLRAKDRPLANDFVSDEVFDQLLAAWFGNIARVLEPGRGFYIWGGYANCANYPPVLKACELYFSQAIIWVKEHPVLTRKDFMGNHEWCQPPDTQVLTPSGSAPIRSLHDGDRVVSFSRSSSAIVGLREGLEVRTTSRKYDGPLYEIVVGGRRSWCTNGHLWTVKLTPQAANSWCVYLMRRGSWWRVGKSKLLSTWGFGLKHRLFTEGGEDGWILSVHPTSTEAAVAEQLVSTRYGIPTTFWRESAATQRSAAQIQQLYERLDMQQLACGAFQALEDHNRSLDYPFITHGHTRPKYGRRVPMTVRACNLLPGMMSIPVPDRGQRFVWAPVRAIDVQPYCGPVYSMEVEKYRHYVADGLVTHNCFYGWREGAAHLFLGPNNAVDVWSIKKVNPQSMVHLTEKPVELAVRAMQYSSRPGENVLDLFGGSGSTLIAAEQTGRRAYLMELDALYCDVIVQRFEKFTGNKAERVALAEVAT
jgi:DNA modification methylase